MIGRLDQQITIQTYTTASDGAGGRIKTWANLSTDPTVWARVQSKGGAERREADRMEATGRYVFTIRNRTDLTEKMRIVWSGENYNIRAIQREGGRMNYLTIIAERGA